MFYDVLKRENVKDFFKDITRGSIYKEKEIPTTISNEEIDSNYYPALIGLDAIIKYIIVINDMIWFDDYLKEVQLLLKKIKKHNDIKIGVYKLLINYTKIKLRLSNITDIENKEEILRYIYKKYILDGYYFHSFPSIFIDDVKNIGLLAKNYNYEIESLKEVDNVFEKYKKNNVFSKSLFEEYKFTITDSPFMACFYAYNSPGFLKELCTGLNDKKNKYEIDCLFMKNYQQSRKNLHKYLKKVDMFNNDYNKVMSLLDKEWDLFNINESFPVMCLIKRSIFNENYSSEINSIIEDSKEENLEICVSKILEIKYNKKEVLNDISCSNLEIVYLPTLEELGYDIDKEKKKQLPDKVEQNEFISNYGSTTIVALAGTLLVMMGLLISLIMMG